jgi:hypothetical protein
LDLERAEHTRASRAFNGKLNQWFHECDLLRMTVA